jgi:hypothetical protein
MTKVTSSVGALTLISYSIREWVPTHKKSGAPELSSPRGARDIARLLLDSIVFATTTITKLFPR